MAAGLAVGDDVMGIFGALTTAVTGLRAQSFALENVSGNIANSQTTAFKRIDTSFVDLIPDDPPGKQLSGNVVANSRSTNTVQGDIQAATIGTFMAINGDGFFVISKASQFTDGQPVFDGIERYTRRGDFQPDKNGFLVNGAGYYLMGIPVDSTTGNLVGSVPQVLQFQNDFLPAQATTQIQYRANLAAYPFTPAHDVDIPQSELLNPAAFAANPIAGPPQPAKITGFGATLSPDAIASLTGTLDVSGLPTGGVNGDLVINGTTIAILATDSATDIETKIDLQTGTTGVSAAIVANRLVLSSVDADTNITINGTSDLPLLNVLGLSVGTTNATNLLTQSAVSSGQTLVIQVGTNPPNAPLTVTFGTGVGEVSTLAELNTELAGLAGGTASASAANGNMTITAGNLTDNIAVTGSANAAAFGIQTLIALPSNGAVVGADLSTFLDQSVSGGAITAFDIAGSPANIQLRWAKLDSTLYGGSDTWNLFYQANANATNSQVAWENVGINYTFGPNGQMDPLVSNVVLNNVVANGISLGTINLVHGSGGITQFADPNGNVQVNLLQQNGFPAGELQSVTINDKGRVVGAYSNGRTLDLAEITLANFTGANYLKRIDGGAFEITDDSGPAIYGAPGKIVGSSLEGSNTDIADEFTKLIVTQQAYSANTRVITTTNQMVQDLLNMLR
jgi:flagellar hook protein FlgE